MPSTQIKTKQIEIIKLGSTHKEKEIEIEFPFGVSVKKNLDSWRCTADQPYCKTYHNDSLELRFCHLFTNIENDYLLKSEVDKNWYLKQLFEEDIISESKRFSGEFKSKLIPIEINDLRDHQRRQSGLIINWKNKSLFVKNYSWATETEYLGLEIRSISDNQFYEHSYNKEIDYIISHIKGIPVHNNR